jgi:hypothetical protein
MRLKKNKKKVPKPVKETKLKIKKKGTETFKHNVNLHLHRFKDENSFKLHPKIKYRLIYLLDKLKSEMAVRKKIRLIVDTNLRHKMRKSKLKSLKSEFIGHVQLVDIKLKIKQKRVEKLANELNECNDIGIHMRKCFSFDYQNMIIDNLKQIIQSLKSNYNKQIEKIKSEFSKEINVLDQIHLNRLSHINKYLQVIEEISINEFKHLNANLKQLEDEQNTNHKNEMLNLKIFYERKNNSLQEAMKLLISDYEKNQKGNLKKYLDLCETIKDSEINYSKDRIKYEKLLTEYKHIKSIPIEDEVLDLKKESFKKLKFIKDQKLLEIDFNRRKIWKSISKLSSITNETIESLKLKHQKACKIIRLIKLCSKLEFFDRFEDNYQNYENIFCASFTSSFQNQGYIINFYKKYNFVELNFRMLKIENKKILNANNNLKNKLRDYLNS